MNEVSDSDRQGGAYVTAPPSTFALEVVMATSTQTINPFYVTEASQLQQHLSSRSDLTQIWCKIDLYIRHKYGINNFRSLLELHFADIYEMNRSSGKPVLFLARQVPSTTFEELTCYGFARHLGYPIAAGSLLIDPFVSKNIDKVSKLKMRMLSRSKKGNLVERIDTIQDTITSEGVRFSHLLTRDGESIGSYHMKLRDTMFRDTYFTANASIMYQEFLRNAKVLPSKVFRASSDGREGVIKNPKLEEVQDERVRPPAEWYYLLYLCMFLDGRIILLETYDNPEHGVDRIKLKFESVMEEIYNQIGLMPIIIKTLPLDVHLVAYPDKKDFQWLKDTVNAMHLSEQENLTVLYEEIYRHLISSL